MGRRRWTACFLVFNLIALAAGVAAVRRRSFVWPVVAGVALWVAAFMTYAAIAVPALLVCLTLADATRGLIRRRVARGFAVTDAPMREPIAPPAPRWRGPILVVVRCVAIGVVFAGCQLVARRAIGYDLRACAESAMATDFRGLQITGYESLPLWACLSLANALALLLGSGVAAIALTLVAIGARARHPFRGRATRFGLATIAAIALLSTSTLFTMETERVWLCLTPAILAAATPALRGWFLWLAVPLGLLGQTIWTEVYYYTWW